MLQSADHKNYIPLPKNNWIQIFRGRHRLQQHVGWLLGFFLLFSFLNLLETEVHFKLLAQLTFINTLVTSSIAEENPGSIQP